MVTRRDGVVIRGTECDQDIEITTGDYTGVYDAHAGITGSDVRSTSDLSVDNLEVVGALAAPGSDTSSSLFLIDVTAADLEAGLLDNAEAVTFLVNARNPDVYQRVLRSGWIGNTTRTAEGRFTTELRGLTQALSQGICKTYSIGCQWELGDARCQVDLGPFTFSDVVDVAISRRQFQYGVGSPTAGIPVHLRPGSLITWTSGLNTGFSMQVKTAISLVATLYLPMPYDIDAGDTYTIRQACDKQQTTCINDYNNILRFGGWGVLVPGDTEVLKVGKR